MLEGGYTYFRPCVHVLVFGMDVYYIGLPPPQKIWNAVAENGTVMAGGESIHSKGLEDKRFHKYYVLGGIQGYLD